MRVLLDTHIFLWAGDDDRRLPPQWRDIIADPENEIYLSAASIWEAIIKHGTGKLMLSDSPARYLPELRQRLGVTPLPVDEVATLLLAQLPPVHRDPFDRILVCQALQHQLLFMTADSIFRQYPVQTLTNKAE